VLEQQLGDVAPVHVRRRAERALPVAVGPVDRCVRERGVPLERDAHRLGVSVRDGDDEHGDEVLVSVLERGLERRSALDLGQRGVRAGADECARDRGRPREGARPEWGHAGERGPREDVRVCSRIEECLRAGRVLCEGCDVERSEAVRAPRVGSGEAVRLAQEEPVPRVVRPVARYHVEDGAPAAIRGVHERGEAAVVAGVERGAVALDQSVHTGSFVGIDELENGHGADY
jgi:hypothetical protein